MNPEEYRKNEGRAIKKSELRELLKVACLTSASGIIAMHNHPGGDPSPSDEDKSLTENLVSI